MTSVDTKHEARWDALLKDCTSPHDILGEHGLLKQRNISELYGSRPGRACAATVRYTVCGHWVYHCDDES